MHRPEARTGGIFLLRNLVIDHNNQVWSTDLSYIPVAHGFLYLIAIIDVLSCFIVAWGLYNTMDTVNCIKVLNAALNRYGTQEILNSGRDASTPARHGQMPSMDMAYMSVWTAGIISLTTSGLKGSGYQAGIHLSESRE
jgi:transposase InsO family protein